MKAEICEWDELPEEYDDSMEYLTSCGELMSLDNDKPRIKECPKCFKDIKFNFVDEEKRK